MKLPIPLLLYVVSLGLFGVAGWTVYEMLPMWKQDVREKAHMKGYNDAYSLRTRGREQGPKSSNWVYSPAAWWEGLKTANLTGKLPPAPVALDKPKEPEKVVVVDERPLAELIELVSLVYDGETGGKGGSSHVILRFKPTANVQAPEWWVKENSAPPPSAAPAAMVANKDTVKAPGNQGRGGAPKLPVKPATAMPTAPGGGVMLQKLWAQDDGDPRRSATLWPIKPNDNREIGTIRLVRVSDDAQSAFFERQLPPPKAGEPAPPPKEEQLIKSAFDLPQDILKALQELQGRAVATAPKASGASAPTTNTWVDVQQTTRINGVVNIGRDDAARWRDNSDSFLDTLNVDTYSSKSGNTRGLIVKGIDPKVASSFGVVPGEVLLEINGRKVESKAQAVSLAKGDYNRGVRTFQTKWLSNGQTVDRTIQAPDK